MRISSRGRVLVPTGTILLFVVVMLIIGTRGVVAQRPAGRGTQRPAAASPPAPATPPQISAAGIRVAGPGLGANGTELRPFNDAPGTVVVLAIQAPRGSGIVEIDSHASKLDAFSDDKGQSLLEEGRVGSFPKISEDGSAALVEVEVRGRPAAGAASVAVQGSLAMTLATGSKPVRAAAVRLETGQTFKVGATALTVGETTTEEESTKVTFGLPRSLLNTIREVRFFDAKNAAIESRRTGSGYFNEKAQLEFEVKTKNKTVTVEFELWQNSRAGRIPFNVQAGLGVAAGARPSGSVEAPESRTGAGTKKPDTPAPPPVVGPTDGADSVEAVVKQLQSAALAGKGAQALAVIYPTERATFGQGVAMALALLPMTSMDNPKAADQVQKQLDAFFARHKLKPPFLREPDELFKGVDLAAFVSDALAFLKARARKGDKAADMLPIPSGRPENVRITGDTAVATLGGHEIKFTRLGGRWFIRLE